MGSSNTFSKALRHLKVSKPSSIHEEVPTNNTQSLYRVSPDTTVETHPGIDQPDFDQDGDGSSGYDGKDTSGLFMPDGTIKTAEPPGDTSYILGPMSSMWYAWGNFTQIGYIRQSDRKMVNLGRITGELQNWDKVSNFTSYGQLTLDQAVWFCNEPKYLNGYANYRAFYPGPPSNTPDEFGRYYCTLTGTPKNTKTRNNTPNTGPEGGGFPWGPGSNPNKKKKKGQGGPGGPGEGGPGEGGPGEGGPGGPGGEGGEGGEGGDGPPDNPIDPNTGEPSETATPEELAKFSAYLQRLAQKEMAGTLTPAEQATLNQHKSDSIFSSAVSNEYKRIEALKNKAPGTHTPAEQQALRNAGLDDFVSGGDTQSPLGNLALLGLTFAGVKTAIAGGLGTLGQALGLTGAATQVAPLIGSADSASDYNKQLAMKLPGSIISGTPAEIKLTPSAAQDQINSLDPAAVEDFLTVGGKVHKPSAQTTVNPTQGTKGPLFGDSGWGTQGASEIHYNPRTDTLTITSEKTLRTTSGGNTVTKDDTGKITSFSDIPTPPPEKVEQISKDLLDNPIIDAALGGLGNVYNAVGGQRGDFQPVEIGPNPWDLIKNDPAAKAEFTKQLSQQGTSLATGAVQGTASNVVALRQALTNLGVPPSEVEKMGGALGQVYSQTNYSGDQIPENIRNIINKQTRTESFKPLPRLPRRTNKVPTINETSHTLDVIRNVKNPVVIEEKKEKVKRRPRVIGSEPRTINSGLMKQAEVPASFKKPEERMWGKYEREQNARASQDRKNVVLDHLGSADQAWEYLLDRNAGKRSFSGYFEKDGTPRTIFTGGKVKKVTREEKIGSDTLIFFTDEEGKKGSILQSEYNELQDQAHTQQMFAEYEATVAAKEQNSFDVIAHRLELKAEKNPTNDKIQSMLSSYRALSHLRKEDKKQEAHFTSWKSSIDGTITSNFQSWVDSVGQETADAVTKVALTEKMSSSNLFGATLPATGDFDHVDMTFDSTYLDPDNDDIVNGAGSGSGYQGGFPVADGENDVIQLSAFGRYSASAYTTDQDLTYVDTLSVTAIAGNGSNGGITPINGLEAYFLGDDDFAGPFTVAPASQSSYVNAQITIPENMRTKNVSIHLYSNSSEYINGMNLSVRHFGDMFFNVPGLDYIRIRDIFPNEAGNADAHGEDFLSLYLGRANYSRSNPDHMYSIGHYYWYNVNAQRFGLIISGSSMEDYVWAQWPPAPVSGNTVGNADGTLNGVPTRADYERVGEMIWDQFVGTKLWGISKISFKRKAPASVYVPLDSPEAINFMRTAPEMQGLTPAQRLKKLKDMLAAGNEYLIKMLGVSGSTATPGPEDYLDGDDELLNDVSPEEQAEIKRNLAKLGPEYAKIAAIPAALPLLATPAGQAALALGAAAVGTLLIQAGINVGGTDWGAAPGRDTLGPLPGTGGTSGGRTLTPDQQAEVEAAGNELRDAQRALNDLPADATDAQRDMAQERLSRAQKNRQRIRNKHKQENKNRND